MSIDAGSTRLAVEVRVTNVGESVAPSFRYMVHAVFGYVPPMAGRAGVLVSAHRRRRRVLRHVRGGKEMQLPAAAPGGSSLQPFRAGRKADKPRYEAGGWAAGLTSAGPAFMSYDPRQFDFMQYWFGGDCRVALVARAAQRAGRAEAGAIGRLLVRLAYDSRDVPFKTGTLAFERPEVPETMLPGGLLKVRARATTVQNKAEQVDRGLRGEGPPGTDAVDENGRRRGAARSRSPSWSRGEASPTPRPWARTAGR